MTLTLPRGVPEADWMSPAWLRSWLDVVGTLIVGAMEQMQLWQHPAALKAFPEPIGAPETTARAVQRSPAAVRWRRSGARFRASACSISEQERVCWR